jgi:hypothetical protein
VFWIFIDFRPKPVRQCLDRANSPVRFNSIIDFSAVGRKDRGQSVWTASAAKHLSLTRRGLRELVSEGTALLSAIVDERCQGYRRWTILRLSDRPYMLLGRNSKLEAESMPLV